MKQLKKYLKSKAEIEGNGNLNEREKKNHIFSLWLDYITDYTSKKRGKTANYLNEKLG